MLFWLILAELYVGYGTDRCFAEHRAVYFKLDACVNFIICAEKKAGAGNRDDRRTFCCAARNRNAAAVFVVELALGEVHTSVMRHEENVESYSSADCKAGFITAGITGDFRNRHIGNLFNIGAGEVKR